MLVQMLSGSDRPVSVYDFGLSNRTELDGLAVGAASMFVAPLMKERLAGIYTIGDARAHDLLRQLHAAGIDVEPSAATALAGPGYLAEADGQGPGGHTQATHVSWTTRGSLVPCCEFDAYLENGLQG